jgi:hypothetical protein
MDIYQWRVATASHQRGRCDGCDGWPSSRRLYTRQQKTRKSSPILFFPGFLYVRTSVRRTERTARNADTWKIATQAKRKEARRRYVIRWPSLVTLVFDDEDNTSSFYSLFIFSSVLVIWRIAYCLCCLEKSLNTMTVSIPPPPLDDPTLSNPLECPPLRWGMLGCGRVSHDFTQALKHLPTQTVVACSARSLDNAKKFAEKHHIHNFCESPFS